MFSPRFQVGSYAVSFQGFKKIIKRTDAMVEVDSVGNLVSSFIAGKPCFCTPGKSEGYGVEKTKILQDEQGEYLQWGRAKHCPKWRPWNGEPIYYSVMNPDNWQGDYPQDGGMKPPPPPPPLPLSPPPPPPPPRLSSASKAEALASALIQEEAEKKKPFIKSPLAYVMAVVAGAIVAPTGLILSPVVLLLSNLKGEYTTNKGQKITPLASWIGTGIVLTPICWITNHTLLSNHSQQDSNQAQLVEKQRIKINENLDEKTIGEPLFRGRSGCERTLKKMLRDPNSLEGEEYVVTAANPQSWTAQIIFRSKNGFGGMNRSVANCTFDGQVYLVNILQDQ